MAHYYIDEEKITVEVFAEISTARNPETWQERTKKYKKKP